MAERIVMRTGEALVEGDKDYLCAEPEVVIGELDGPVGHGPRQPDRRPGEGAHPGLRHPQQRRAGAAGDAHGVAR